MIEKQDRLIVSVPHSGTRFLKERLGWNEHRHTIGSHEALLADIRRYNGKVIIPLRHPQDVLASWMSRQRHQLDFWVTQFGMAWAQLQQVADTCDCVFVEIEKKDYPGITDWSPVGNTDKKSGDAAEADYINIGPIFTLPIVKTRYKARQVKRRPKTT